MKILVVDDEQDLCEILQFNLEMEGYEVDTANSAEEALTMPISTYNLLLLDVMMGEMSGFQMARILKDNPATAHVPIIFLTALDTEENTVKGLNIGADDYMRKPVSIRELKARVKAVLRRSANVESVHNSETEDGETVTYETLCLNSSSKTVTLDGEKIALTKLEFELLNLFLRKPNTVFDREELLKRCWPSDTYVLDRTVDVNITRLRKKIGKYGKQIKTRFGYGYTFEK